MNQTVYFVCSNHIFMKPIESVLAEEMYYLSYTVSWKDFLVIFLPNKWHLPSGRIRKMPSELKDLEYPSFIRCRKPVKTKLFVFWSYWEWITAKSMLHRTMYLNNRHKSLLCHNFCSQKPLVAVLSLLRSVCLQVMCPQ